MLQFGWIIVVCKICFNTKPWSLKNIYIIYDNKYLNY